MPYLVKADLYTHIPQAEIDAITNNTDATVTAAINAAIAEAKSYLSRFNLAELFHDTTPLPADANLKNKVKDIACWHLVRLANPNISLELFKESYDDAVKWLTGCAKGLIDPDGWNLKTDDADTSMTEGALIGSSSNTKRNNHFN